MVGVPADLQLKRAADLSAKSFEGEIVPLYELMMASIRAGGVDIRDRTFRHCRIEGPAVMLVGEATFLNACALGDARGDVRNLLLRPLVGFYTVGVLPVVNCRFDDCTFVAIGYTGSDYLLQDLQKVR